MARPVLTSEPVGVPARRAALRLLDGVLRRGLAIEAQLDRATQGLAPSDRGLAHAIAAETLRWLPDLDLLIDSATRSRIADDAKARMALRIALVQALRLGTPQHAAIATALPLVEGGPRKLVHGVFGALMRAQATLPEMPGLPDLVAARWAHQHGDAMVEAARAAIAQPPLIDLSLAHGEVEAPEGVALAERHVRLPAGASVPALEGFAEGGWWVQDLAASLPARLLGPGAGDVLDLCAAPGGKTLQLAAAGWNVTAIDSSPARLAMLAQNLTRTGLAAKIVTADLLKWEPPAPADALLLDAPCSATGIFRRHPDVLHRVRPAIVAETAATQAAMLARAADWVRPGGTLVYAVCSLERAEGEEQLARFLAARSDYAVLPIDAGELPEGITAAADGTVRTLPGMLAEAGGIDGFFIARLRCIQ